MKIAIIGPAYPYRGGIASYNERLALELQNEGHEVVIYNFTLQYPSFLFPGKTQYSTDKGPTSLKIIRCIHSMNPFNWFKTGRMIRKTSPDLVITRFWIPFMGPALGTIIKRIKKNKNTKVIAIVDNIIPHESRLGDKFLTQYFVNQMDGFIAMSNSVYNDICQFDNEKPKTLTPHPLYDHFGEVSSSEEAKKALNLDPNFNYILFFGLIRKYKGLDLLIQAFSDSKLRNLPIKLLVAGEYYDEPSSYKKLISELELTDLVIEADHYIPDEKVKHYFNACDVVVQPYKSATQSGVTQIAYHFNKPMIVTDVGGLAELCPNNVVGYVTQPEVSEISEAILKFFTSEDKNTFEEGIQKEKKKFAWSILTKEVFDLYEKI